MKEENRALKQEKEELRQSLSSLSSFVGDVQSLLVQKEREKHAVLEQLVQTGHQAEGQKLAAEKLQEQTIRQAELAIALKQKEIDALQVKLRSLGNELVENRHGCIKFSQNIQRESWAALASLQQKFEQASQKLELKQKEIDALQLKLRSLESELVQNRKRHMESSQKIQKESCAALASLQQKFEQACQKLELKQNELESLGVRLQLCEEETNRVKQQSNLLEQRLNLESNANRYLQQRIEVLNAELLEVKEEKNKLEQQILKFESASSGSSVSIEDEYLLFDDQLSADVDNYYEGDSGNSNLQTTTAGSWPRFGSQSHRGPSSPYFFDVQKPDEKSDCVIAYVP